jgi:hypothetical protein
VDIRVEELADGHLARFMASFEAEGQKCVQKMALTGQSLVQHRIQEKGIPGKKYSKNKLPAFFFDDKASTAAGRKAVDDAQPEGISYEDFRVADGKQVDHVDLTFSGRMFGGTRIIRILASGATFVAQVGGTDAEVDAKLGYAVQHYGENVFDPTPEEQTEVDEIAEDFLSNLFSEFL